MAEKVLELDVRRIRGDFPVLKRRINGKPLIYFDNAATSQKPLQVIRAIEEYYRWYNANIHRGIHKLAEEATLAHEEAREKVAKFINARRPQEIVFVRNTTEAINLVAYSWGRANIKEGDVIVLTEMEHHSNIVPWQLLAKEKKAKLRYVRVDDEGFLVGDDLEKAMEEGPKLVCVTHVSNVLGTINPVGEIIKLARKAGALTLVDGAQAVPHMPVDAQALGADFYAFSGHKMMGPMGIGVLYGRMELLEDMGPFLGGGEMISEVYLHEARFKAPPYKFEAGTPNVEGAIGLGAAVDYLRGIGMERVRAHERDLVAYALDRLGEVEGLTVYGPKDPKVRGGVISFNLGKIHAHDLATILDEEGIAIRSGHHCAMPLHERFGIPASARASFYVYNTKEEVDVLAQALEKAKKIFRL